MMNDKAGSSITRPESSKFSQHPEPDNCNCMDSMIPSLAVILIFISCTILQWIFICPWYVQTYSTIIWLPIVVVFSLTTITTAINFLYASFMNPGFLPKAPDMRYLKRQPSWILVNGVRVHLKNCRTCHYYRMPRTVHCGQCDHCVDNFDHHCPWVNNCIGRRNYRFFFSFLCCLTVHMSMSISICIFYILKLDGISVWDAPKVTAYIVSISAGLIFVPVAGLLCFHIFLIMKGFSTYEYVTKKYKDSGGKSPFDMGPCRNCAFQLCGPEYPVFKSLELSTDDEDSSRNVQRELLVKFQENSNNPDQENDESPSRKVEKFDNLATGGETLFDENNNLSGGGDNENVNHPQNTGMTMMEDVDCTKNSAENNDKHKGVHEGGDAWHPIPIEILQHQQGIQYTQIIIPSP